jgi:TIR domain/Nucleoside 2-deoxyribosyltransferase
MKTPSVFISHSAKQEIGSLLEVLRSEKVKILDAFDLAASRPIGATIRSAIDRADAIIAVFSSESDSANVSFEVGYATALRKPVFLLLKPGNSVPEFTSGLRYLVSDVTDSQILRIGVQGFLRDIASRGAKQRSVRTLSPSVQPDRPAIRTLLERLGQLRSSIEPAKVERFTADLLRAASVTALEEHEGVRDRRADFALWSDDLHSSLGNPILVEVKTGNLSEPNLNEAYNRLAHQVSESDARLGLLLYLDHNGRRFRRPGAWVPVVLAFDLEDFARQLLTHSFAEALLESRNKLVHGMS